MSDTGKRGEIEDVLTAIRRLLAQDGEGREVRLRGERAAGERLILTPELRVEQKDEHTASIEDALAMLEAAVAARAVSPSEAENLQDVDEAPFIAIDEPEAHGADPVAFRHGHVRRFQLIRSTVPPEDQEGEELRVEAARPPVEVPTEPDIPTEIPPETPDEAPPVDIPEDPVEIPAEVPVEEPVEAPDDTPDELPVDNPPGDEMSDHATDEASLHDPQAEAYLPEEVRADADVCAAPVLEPAFDDDTSLFGEDSVTLDDHRLRNLVGEILREELQGPLGERMTRNVRKLVRAEIRRALAGREFE